MTALSAEQQATARSEGIATGVCGFSAMLAPRPRVILVAEPLSPQSNVARCCSADTPLASRSHVSRSRLTTCAGPGDYTTDAWSRLGL